MKHRADRRERLKRLDAWLLQLRGGHPLLFGLLGLALGAAVFGLAMLLKFLLQGGR